MRILFVAPYAPRHIRTRPYFLLRALAARGHSITLATIWQNEEERQSLSFWQTLGMTVLSARLPRLRWLLNCVTALPRPLPLQAVYSWQPELVRQIDQTLAGAGSAFDVIHVEHLRGSSYGLHVRQRGLPVVWDSVDCISLLFEEASSSSTSMFGQMLARIDLGRTRAYEPWLASQFDRVLITSPIDKAALERLGRDLPEPVDLTGRVTVLPNGVDLVYFQPGSAARQKGNIVFTGRMSYHANITAASLFARQVLPLIWAQRPDATFTIAGYDPTPEVRVLANDRRITVTGTATDLRPYLQGAEVAVAPMPYGTGIQNKILEAMACATPVVTTPQPLAALLATAGEHLLVAEQAPGLARHVLALLENAELRQRIGQAGRRYVEEHHDWQRVVLQLEAIYQDAIARRRGASDA